MTYRTMVGYTERYVFIVPLNGAIIPETESPLMNFLSERHRQQARNRFLFESTRNRNQKIPTNSKSRQ